jgi:uncharacterized membrane protein SpoIIM required for sporulation
MKNIVFYFFIALIIWIIPFIIGLNIKRSNNSIFPTFQNLNFKNNIELKKNLELSPSLKKEKFWEIFTNNLKVNLLNVSGIGFFGIPSFLNLVVNGFVLGVIYKSFYNSGLSINIILNGTLPHSIEFFGIWLSGAIGLKGFSICYKFIRFNSFPTKKEIYTLLILLLISILIITIAAWLEVYITLKVLSW